MENKKYKKSDYNVIYDIDNNEKIIFNTRSLGLSVINNKEYEVYLNLDENLEKECMKDTIEDMYENGYIVDKDLNELDILKYRLNKERYSKDTLRLTIAPTMNCNFNCSYCYEKQGEEKNLRCMSKETQENLIEFIEKRLEGSKKLDIVWYGGEPLLEFEKIKYMSEKIMDICNSKNIKYVASMVTNGYLLDKFSTQEFKDINIRDLQITIDGQEKIHNHRRPLINGDKTYTKIVENIKSYQDELLIAIRINIDRENVKNLDDLIKDFKNNGLTNCDINIAPVINSENPKDPNCINIEEFTKIWIEFIKNCRKYGINKKPHMIPKVANYCDADAENSFVIDSQGYIYKCWRDIGNTNLSVSNFYNDKKENKQLFYKYITCDSTENEMCKKCNMMPICMGGCPSDRLKNIDSCTRYKYCLKDILLDLVKY